MHRRRRITCKYKLALALSISVFPFACACAQDVPPVVGPLVGEVTESTASLWMYAGADDKVEVTYHTEASDAKKVATFKPIAEPAADELKGRGAKVTLTDLTASTRYQYTIAINGKPQADRSGTFKTAPRSGKSAKFRLGLTSCMKFGQKQASWKLFLADEPDLHLTLGDTQYSDTTEPNTQWRHHLRYRSVPEFAEALRNVPTYAMWDDHDYGPNNSDGTARGKENSLEGWKQVWANPQAGTQQTPGAFYRFAWGDVDFFVVDGRYHRSPDNAKDDDNKRMLGDAQFEWLLDGLKNSKAKFKVIASGSTLDHSKNDGWKIYTFSRHRLFGAIKENGINGVVYMSGDIHRSLVWQHPEQDLVGYPMVEVISSGIANSSTLSYATVDFDTTLDDPTMRVRIVMGTGKVSDDRTWKLSQLSHQ